MDLLVPGPVGRLEAQLWMPPPEGGVEVAPRAAAVVCHPDPAQGGEMQNAVVYRAARGLQQAGLAVLRFNFRGVGRSAGTHDGRGAEELDASAALDELERRFPDLELWGAGYSFGARTMSSLAIAQPRIRRLVCIALPTLVWDCPALERLRIPGLILTGGADVHGNLADLRARCGELPAALELDEIAGADHMFRGLTRDLQERVRAFATRALEGSPAERPRGDTR